MFKIQILKREYKKLRNSYKDKEINRCNTLKKMV